MWFLKTVYPRLTLGKISGIRQMGHWPPILNPYRQPLLTNVTNLYLLAVTETKRCYVTIKHLNLNFPQQCNLKVYSRWLWIFLSLKSPEEWEITKQACRDESVVFFLLPIFISRSTLTYRAALLRKNRTSKHRLPTYIHTYTLFTLEILQSSCKANVFEKIS